MTHLTIEEWNAGRGCEQHLLKRVIDCHDCAMLEPEYAEGFTDEELREHYKALIDDLPDELVLTREDMIEQLRGTEFDEHAYTYAGK